MNLLQASPSTENNLQRLTTKTTVVVCPALEMPAVVTVKEGINLPRYPSLPGRLRAKRAAVGRAAPEWGKGPGRNHRQPARPAPPAGRTPA